MLIPEPRGGVFCGLNPHSLTLQVAHGDLNAYAMHKRAKERMVSTRGGIRKLSAELQDELLKYVEDLPLTFSSLTLTFAMQERVLPATLVAWQVCM